MSASSRIISPRLLRQLPRCFASPGAKQISSSAVVTPLTSEDATNVCHVRQEEVDGFSGVGLSRISVIQPMNSFNICTTGEIGVFSTLITGSFCKCTHLMHVFFILCTLTFHLYCKSCRTQCNSIAINTTTTITKTLLISLTLTKETLSVPYTQYPQRLFLRTRQKVLPQNSHETSPRHTIQQRLRKDTPKVSRDLYEVSDCFRITG
jgi:hypothetical protein